MVEVMSKEEPVKRLLFVLCAPVYCKKKLTWSNIYNMSHQRKNAYIRNRTRLEELEIRDKRRVPTLGTLGMSVFRPVEGSGLEKVSNIFESYTSHIGRSIRGQGKEHRPSLNQLQLKEVMRQKHLMRNILVQDAIDEVYCSVDTVRHRQVTQFGKVSILGSQNAPLIVIGLTFDEQGAETLRTERNQILECLEGLSDFKVDNPEDSPFSWTQVSRPHISIGRVSREMPKPNFNEMMGAIEAASPAEFVLKNAVLYNPAHNLSALSPSSL